MIRNTTELSHILMKEYTGADITAVDATCGNGHDTLWLSERCGRVYAFDIQQDALDQAKALTSGHDNIEFILDTHENMARYVKEAPGLIIFNLGYFPGGDKSVTTETSSTLNAVKTSLSILKKDALLLIVMYWGHEEGKKERTALLHFASALDKRDYHVIHTEMLNQSGTPPEILLIEKKR